MATETWYPKAKRLPITTQEYTKVRTVPTISICEHITAGTDSRDWLQHADNQSSVHFLIRVEGGKAVVYQFMPIEWAAWGNGRYSKNNPYMPAWARDMVARGININNATISVEHEGVTPTEALYTGPMLEATIALNKWIKSVVPTLLSDREHVIGHYQIDHIQRANCPGGPGGTLFPFDTVIAAMNAPAGAENPDANGYFKATGYSIGGAIRDHWHANGGVPEFGYPLSQEQPGNVSPWSVLPELAGYTCQLFEYKSLAWRADTGVVTIRTGAIIDALA